ncbi:prefoldin subunit 6-like [Hydractinia symbiolongicarpus]|uniref:prefoldin subunit 6-like n=1 Tax=Hydractinia symbiolongicarpus TaxID=13093 RepID=UPI00254D0150|nr:prefoldin subunit 6-like [Hydractinia symbiolongicarpus]
MAKVQEQLQLALESYQKLQKDIQKMVTGRQQLDAQYNENKIVKDELDVLEAGANVYKLTGPVLVKQDLAEAKLNVQKRLDYIQGELKRHEKSIKDLQSKQESQRETLAKLQQQYQGILQKQGVKV